MGSRWRQLYLVSQMVPSDAVDQQPPKCQWHEGPGFRLSHRARPLGNEWHVHYPNWRDLPRDRPRLRIARFVRPGLLQFGHRVVLLHGKLLGISWDATPSSAYERLLHDDARIGCANDQQAVVL